MKTKLTLLLLILSVATMIAQPDQRIAKTPKINYDWGTGFISTTEFTGAFGLSIRTDPYSKHYYGITTAAGYQFSRNIKASIGAGVQFHNGGNFFPIFLDARYSFNAEELVPFITAAGGLALNFNEQRTDFISRQCIFINPGIGLKWVTANRKSISVSSGLMIMSATAIRNSFLNFKLGFEFKGR